MTAYAGRGQPPVALNGNLVNSWWNITPSYTTATTSPTLVGPVQAAPFAGCAPPPGSRSIAIMIPRDFTDGTAKR
jgi:hypothetical protein